MFQCHQAVMSGHCWGPLFGECKGVSLPPSPPFLVFRPVGWTTRSKLSVPRIWRRRSTRGKQRGSIQPGWNRHPPGGWQQERGTPVCYPAWMRCFPRWDRVVFQDGAGMEVFSRVGMGQRTSWGWDGDIHRCARSPTVAVGNLAQPLGFLLVALVGIQTRLSMASF